MISHEISLGFCSDESVQAAMLEGGDVAKAAADAAEKTGLDAGVWPLI